MLLVRVLLSVLVVGASATAALATWHRRHAERADAAEKAMLAQLARRGSVDPGVYAVQYADSSFELAAPQRVVVPDSFVRSLRAGEWMPEPGGGFGLVGGGLLDMLLPPPRQAAIRTADGARYHLLVYSSGRDRWTLHVQGSLPRADTATAMITVR